MILEKNKDIQTHFSHVPPFSQPIKTWHLIHMRERERERECHVLHFYVEVLGCMPLKYVYVSLLGFVQWKTINIAIVRKIFFFWMKNCKENLFF